MTFSEPSIRCLAAISLAVAAAGCSAPAEIRVIGSRLDILGPTQAFSEQLAASELPADWFKGGHPLAANISVTTIDQLPALRIVSAAKPFALLRRTRASLLATPYLSWHWQAAAIGEGNHPVRMVVGFANAKSPGERRTAWFPGSGDLPDEIDRLAMIVWSDTALRRGTAKMLDPKAGAAEAFEYAVRGGGENAGKWWVDSVDLSRLFAAAWPGDDLAAMEIRLIGIAAAPSATPTAMYVANIRLSR
ncbi:MAG: DUF3047 domain-containing protein [Proteobacteria bacterium]|nr:DUF3047 domain-containing protein [Pseudomonadota bacterium]